MSQHNRVQLFDNWAARYDRSVEGGTGIHQGYEDVLTEVARLADVQPDMLILDLGVGTGNLARRFIELGCLVWGLDFSTKMLAKAQIKIPQARLLQGDLLGDWPAELGQPFDRVVSSYVFHEFDLRTKVRLLKRLVKHCLAGDGRIVIGDIAFPTLQALKQAGADRWDEEEYYWAADEAIAACERKGLRVAYRQVSSCGGVFVVEPT